jgi:hypothetical protein
VEQLYIRLALAQGGACNAFFGVANCGQPPRQDP